MVVGVCNQGHNGIQSVYCIALHQGACFKVLEQILPGGQLMLGPLKKRQKYDRQVERQGAFFTFY